MIRRVDNIDDCGGVGEVASPVWSVIVDGNAKAFSIMGVASRSAYKDEKVGPHTEYLIAHRDPTLGT